MDYGSHLANLGLQSLEYRRVLFLNVIMCYKIVHNRVDLPFDSFFYVADTLLCPAIKVLTSSSISFSFPLFH